MIDIGHIKKVPIGSYFISRKIQDFLASQELLNSASSCSLEVGFNNNEVQGCSQLIKSDFKWNMNERVSADWYPSSRTSSTTISGSYYTKLQCLATLPRFIGKYNYNSRTEIFIISSGEDKNRIKLRSSEWPVSATAWLQVVIKPYKICQTRPTKEIMNRQNLQFLSNLRVFLRGWLHRLLRYFQSITETLDEACLQIRN